MTKRLIPIVVVFPSIILIGTIGYHFVEFWSWTDSFYMSVITVTTVGFSEVTITSFVDMERWGTKCAESWVERAVN